MESIDTITKKVEALPLIKYYMDELGLRELFQQHVSSDVRCNVDPADAYCMLILNIATSAQPLYKIDEWLADYMDGQGESMDQASRYNDDCLARRLDYLWEADRGTLMTELAGRAIALHKLETDRIHNDTTTITFTGAYNEVPPGDVELKRGYNKDHRPDYKQLVYGLNVTGDGHVPLSFHLYDGNQADSTTHIPNWDSLREFLGQEDFLYIADSKLATKEALAHIANGGGRFISLLPATRSEASDFSSRLQAGEEVEWTLALQRPNSRHAEQIDKYHTYEERSQEGYRIIWVHSNRKEKEDEGRRNRRIAQAEKELEALVPKLNRRNYKEREAIEAKLAKIQKGKLAQWLTIDLQETQEEQRCQAGRGRPGPNTIYSTETIPHYQLHWERNEEILAGEKRTDGLFPLISNDMNLSTSEILVTYKDQPYLEKRFSEKKSVLDVAPVYLKTPSRIESMLFLYFVTLMIISLVERRIRNNMEIAEIEKLPILPQGMKTKKPTWNNIRYFFRTVFMIAVMEGNRVIHRMTKGLTDLHKQVLALLEVPSNIYNNLRDFWWIQNVKPT